MEFCQFKTLFQSNFNSFIKEQSNLYLTDVSKDELWDTYLNSFPEDVRQEFNCNSCKQFIKNYGNLVVINSAYNLESYWQFEISDYIYQQVADNLKQLVLSRPIKQLFVSDSSKLGTDSNWDLKLNIQWQHLFHQLPKTFKTVSKDSTEPLLAKYRDDHNVFKRSLDELTDEAVSSVLELIEANNLYKGQEFKGLLTSFYYHKANYNKLSSSQKDNYCWKLVGQSGALLRIRNTSIGTLLINLSEGMSLDTAVNKFEVLVAPTNYKRPNPVVTSKMIQEAQKTIESLDLASALNRRFATIDDLNVNNLLFVNRNKSQSNIFQQLQAEVLVNPKTYSNAKQITLDQFVSEVLPHSSTVEVLLENQHENNLVSLITSAEESEKDKQLFKWNNSFSWAYRKGLSDSLTDKVKAAGGKVEGKLRISLEWHNLDDLDVHVNEPQSHIYYARKRSHTGGELDVDMNFVGSLATRTPVENIIYPYNSRMDYGNYMIGVHNYTYREQHDQGFKVEVEFGGQIYEFNFDKNPAYKKYVDVATFVVNKEGVIELKTNSTPKLSTKTVWGLNTNKWHPVTTIMWSPNYWANNSVGNKHLFFMLDKTLNNESTKGLFNEFLCEELYKHRKVFEVISQTQTIPHSNNQLSGLGFSTTLRNTVIVKVDNSVYKLAI